MLKAQVQVGSVYVAKISGRLTTVRLDSLCSYGGWNATNVATNRTVHIKSAAKLRREHSTSPTYGLLIDKPDRRATIEPDTDAAFVDEGEVL